MGKAVVWIRSHFIYQITCLIRLRLSSELAVLTGI